MCHVLIGAFLTYSSKTMSVNFYAKVGMRMNCWIQFGQHMYQDFFIASAAGSSSKADPILDDGAGVKECERILHRFNGNAAVERI